MPKFLKCEISRSESTDVYLKVPDDSTTNWRDWRTLELTVLPKAVRETTTGGEWDQNPDIELHGLSEVPAEEALQYATFDVETGKRAVR